MLMSLMRENAIMQFFHSVRGSNRIMHVKDSARTRCNAFGPGRRTVVVTLPDRRVVEAQVEDHPGGESGQDTVRKRRLVLEEGEVGMSAVQPVYDDCKIDGGVKVKVQPAEDTGQHRIPQNEEIEERQRLG